MMDISGKQTTGNGKEEAVEESGKTKEGRKEGTQAEDSTGRGKTGSNRAIERREGKGGERIPVDRLSRLFAMQMATVFFSKSQMERRRSGW